VRILADFIDLQDKVKKPVPAPGQPENKNIANGLTEWLKQYL
jgi:hypothetical protein